MKFRNKRRWRIIRDYCIGWTLALVFLSIVRGMGTTENGTIQMDFWTSMLFSISLGPVFGSISGYAQVLTEEKVYKRISIQRLILLRLVYVILFLLSLISITYLIFRVFYDLNIGFIDYAFDEGSFPVYLYLVVVDLGMSILRQINLLLGENNLGKLLRGKFYSPREEERIFMFLDLQSSTQIAEKLGHIKYSMLIQDCFNDLAVVVENEAEIYQYVGDEVILTWEAKEGIRNLNCINAYFRFRRQLEKKRSYYEQKYGCMPFFKAGMNVGIVTVTEVGKYKKEIAYHGDTINTAARIQGKCNDFRKELLISESLKNRLNTNAFQFEMLGSIPLRGKEKEVLIYGGSKTEN